MQTSIVNASNEAAKWIDNNSPQILTGFGIAGMISACVSTGIATKNLVHELDKAGDISRKEKIKKAVPHYILPGILVATSSVCLIKSCSINTRRVAALAGALTAAENKIQTYKKKIKEVVKDEEKVEEIEKEVAQETSDINVQKSYGTPLPVVGEVGDTIFCDEYGHYWKSDKNYILTAEREINSRLRSELVLSLDDILYCINKVRMPNVDGCGAMIDHYSNKGFEIYFRPVEMPVWLGSQLGYEISFDTCDISDGYH